MDQTFNYGVLGSGYFGAEFARAITEQPGAKLAMIYSPNAGAKKLCAELACEAAASAEALIGSDKVDAVIVATPNFLHKEHVLLAAKASKHVFCEKPFALSADDAREMIAACQHSGAVMMVGHIMHFYSGIAQLKHRIDEGELGDIINAHVERTGWEHKKAEVSWKKQQSKSGGHLFHHIHEIDILQWLLGEPKDIYAVGDNLGHRQEGFGDEADVLLLTLRFKSGALASMQYGSGFRMGNHFIRINGTKGGAVIDFKAAEITIKLDDSQQSIPLFDDEESVLAIKALFERTDGGIAYGSPDERPPAYILTALRSELKAFREAAQYGRIPSDKADLFDGVSAVRSVAIAENALASIAQRQVIYF